MWTRKLEGRLADGGADGGLGEGAEGERVVSERRWHDATIEVRAGEVVVEVVRLDLPRPLT